MEVRRAHGPALGREGRRLRLPGCRRCWERLCPRACRRRARLRQVRQYGGRQDAAERKVNWQEVIARRELATCRRRSRPLEPSCYCPGLVSVPSCRLEL